VKLVDLGTIAGRAVAGLVAGTLVGLTGFGGGMVLLPVLISILDVPPVVAVGSDALVNCITKIGAGGLHWRRGSVRWRLVFDLAYGSIPGVMLGVLALARVRATYGEAVNEFLRVAIGILLVVLSIGYLLCQRSANSTRPLEASRKGRNRLGVTLIGFIAGLLVGVTSIGSGSVILMLLLIFYGLPPAQTVGTDIVHGVVLAGLAGLFQFNLGNVDLLLVGSVLIGSVPGGIAGAYLTKFIPSIRFKRMLCALLVAVGARMIWRALLHAN
jgi:uncharacterized membrane protein YfcA